MPGRDGGGAPRFQPKPGVLNNSMLSRRTPTTVVNISLLGMSYLCRPFGPRGTLRKTLDVGTPPQMVVFLLSLKNNQHKAPSKKDGPVSRSVHSVPSRAKGHALPLQRARAQHERGQPKEDHVGVPVEVIPRVQVLGRLFFCVLWSWLHHQPHWLSTPLLRGHDHPAFPIQPRALQGNPQDFPAACPTDPLLKYV